jgi:hypothetical protein
MNSLEKIVFPLEDDWHGFTTETLWARRPSDGLLQIVSVPFFAFGVSRFDVVCYKKENDFLKFDSIMQKSGHSTYRISLAGSNNIAVAETFIESLAGRGIEMEEAKLQFRYFALDIGRAVDIERFYREISELQVARVIAFEEGDFGRSAI